MVKLMYVCDKCQETYDNHEDAEFCETDHVTVKDVTCWYSKGIMTPYKITVSFSNNDIRTINV
jgi:hypothetical protein